MGVTSSSIAEELKGKISANKSLSIRIERSKELNSQLLLDKKEIASLLESLFRNSIKDDYYFFDCPLAVYKNSFKVRFEKFVELNLDAERADFIQSEIRKLYDPEENRVIITECYHIYSEGLASFKISLDKKLSYLKEELNKEGFYMSNGPIENISPYEDIPLDDEIRFDVVEDVRDGKLQITANQIVILLDKVGFFNDKKIRLKSQAKQSEVISKITGLNVKNIATYISRLEQKPSSIGANYQKDLDYIDSMLDDI
ncbi:hypothetical protein LNP27_02405 [Flavobacterium galactosidilyticum]|uniref:hypothetical protein n=1 Tax=Flavobacterium galactosidilyticum TaxID=2893886 RepID=UPI001E3041E1|nr:hypothetical protein [Flavobacterium sp. F-340]UFH46905.1 hypothetical protein LNP27_02405 [Flavobacterium sp. F-340]